MNFDSDEENFSQAEDSGEGMMASFADMMTLLLGFFIILYSLSTMDEKKFFELGKSISASFKSQDTDELDVQVTEVMQTSQQQRAFQMLIAVLKLGSEQEAVAKIEQLYSEMTKAKDSKQVLSEEVKELKELKAKVNGGNDDDDVLLELILPSSSLFASGSDRLTPAATKQLSGFARTIERVKENISIEIVGHTDSRPPARSSKFDNNWQLSAARATAVARQFERTGIPGGYMSVTGRSSFDPLYPEKDARGRLISQNLIKNRRVQITIRKTVRQ